jgi:hypothetical protein
MGFRLVSKTAASGKACEEVFGIDGGVEWLSWSSVTGIQNLAEQYGISKAIWPVYRDIEVESRVPLDDAEEKSGQLKAALELMPQEVIEKDHWLGLIWKLLQQGHAFFIMV